MRGDLYYRVLGPVTVERDGSPLRLGGPQARGVLAMLVLRAGGVVPVDQLSDALWGDHPPVSFRTQIQSLVSGLRRALTAPVIVTEAPGYRLQAQPAQIDLEEFRRETALAQRHMAAGAYRPAAELLDTALARWSGPACADLAYCPVRQAAIALDELRTSAFEDRLEADIGLEHNEDVIAELTALTREHPLRERFRSQLMTVLARAGRRDEALAVYRNARETLVEELGLEPSADLQSVHQAVLDGAVDSGARGPGRPAPRQLPPRPPAIVGRDTLLSKLTGAPRDAENTGIPPCLALTGPGGTGKTTVALALAHQWRSHYPDGQLFARLGGTGTALVLHRFLSALGVPASEIPDESAERAALLRTLLAPRRMLIVLDDADDEAQVRPLIPAAGGCALIVTSRRRLDGVEQLRQVPLGVLSTGAGVALLKEIAGASRVDADLAAAAAIVRHCGGLPLALRIAGARLAGRLNWTVGDMATRLADARDRLDWLRLGDLDVRASVAETYSGLSGDQQRLFRLLGLHGGHTFPEWLAAALLDGPPGLAGRTLDHLIEVHLVEPAGVSVTGPRYRMHDLLRLVARELALATDASEDRRAAQSRVEHGWLSLAATADSGLPHWVGLDPEPAPRWHPPDRVRGAVRADPWGWFDGEWAVLADVVREAADRGGAGVAWPVAQRLSTYLDMRGRNLEWAGVLAAGLRAAELADDRQGRATMLGLLCHVAANRDDYLESLQYAHQTLHAYQALGSGSARPEPEARLSAPGLGSHVAALRAARESGDALGVAFAASRLVHARRIAGQSGGYLGLFEEASEGFRTGGIPLLEAWTTKYTGLIYCRQGRFAEAAGCVARVEAILKDYDGSAEVYAGRDLAGFAAVFGRAEAGEMAREDLKQARAIADQWSVGRCLITLGEVARQRGDDRGAYDSYTEALAVWRRLNVPGKVNQVMDALTNLSADMPRAVPPGGFSTALED